MMKVETIDDFLDDLIANASNDDLDDDLLCFPGKKNKRKIKSEEWEHPWRKYSNIKKSRRVK